jgi:hypothetical protein
VEMADIVRCAGQAFIEHSRRWINWQHRKVLLAIALPHRCTGRASRSLHRLRTYDQYLLQLVSYGECLFLGSSSVNRRTASKLRARSALH